MTAVGVASLTVGLSFVPACGSGSPHGPGPDAAGGDGAADTSGDGGGGAGGDAPVDVARSDDAGADHVSTDAAPGDAVTDAGTVTDSLAFDAMLGADPTPCNDLQNTAPVIEPQTLAANVAVPTGFGGGTIPDGTYELVSVDFYPASNGPTPQPYYQRTVVFQANTTHGLMADLSKVARGWVVGHPSFAVMVTPNATLTETGDACASGLLNEYQYELSGGMLTLWYPKGGTLQRYRPAP
jgi:hypothetical protein